MIYEWSFRVSHTKIRPPIEEDPLRANNEVIIEHEHTRDNTDSMSINMSCINMVDERLHDNLIYTAPCNQNATTVNYRRCQRQLIVVG